MDVKTDTLVKLPATDYADIIYFSFCMKKVYTRRFVVQGSENEEVIERDNVGTTPCVVNEAFISHTQLQRHCNGDTACFSAGRMLLILAFYFSNYCMNCTSDELKTSNITRDIGTVTDSPPLPFMNLFKCRHAFSGVELA